MSDTSFILPIIPTFKEICDCFHTICQNRTSRKLSSRQAIWNAYIALNDINIYSIKLLAFSPTDFDNVVAPIFDQINAILMNYVDSQILYIKPNRNNWITEWISLYQQYNMFKSGNHTPKEMIDFAECVKVYYSYIFTIFEDKYKSNF